MSTWIQNNPGVSFVLGATGYLVGRFLWLCDQRRRARIIKETTGYDGISNIVQKCPGMAQINPPSSK